MAKLLISYIQKIFIDNWSRKILALFISIIIWLLVNDTIKNQKIYSYATPFTTHSQIDK